MLLRNIAPFFILIRDVALSSMGWFQFRRYFSVGVINTLLHWVIFYLLVSLGLSQAMSNLLAFLVAVTFSYFVNSKVTFNSQYSFIKYVLFTGLMGIIAFTFGLIADYFSLAGIYTLVAFSATSFVLGFIISKVFIFKDPKSE